MRRGALGACLLALCFAGAAHSDGTSKQRCDAKYPPSGSFADCFSGRYHGTGFSPPMGDTMSFRVVTPAALHANALWRLWLADSRHSRVPPPCANPNAIPYVGSFTYYGGGVFIGCSLERPYMLDGFYRVKHAYPFPNDDGAGMVLTHGPLSAAISSDNVVELVFSDAGRDHFAQPELALGPSPAGG